jgi:hypothetical protein
LPTPGFDQNLGLPQGVEYLAAKELIIAVSLGSVERSFSIPACKFFIVTLP